MSEIAKGTLITFEGIDGAGKTTQIELLKENLEKMNKTVHVFREPGGNRLSEKIRSLLLSTSEEIDAITELLLFSSARSMLVSSNIIPALERGEIVILDRFYDSTTAYQGYGRGNDLSIIETVNRIAGHSLVPDITIYLRLNLEESYKRRKGENDRMEQAGKEFYEKVIHGFDTLAQKNKRFHIIDANLPKKIISSSIFQIINATL